MLCAFLVKRKKTLCRKNKILACFVLFLTKIMLFQIWWNDRWANKTIVFVLVIYSTSFSAQWYHSISFHTSQVLPRDAKTGTTVEHVKQLRDDITSTTAQTFRDTIGEADQLAQERAARLETRLTALEANVAKIKTLLETAVGARSSAANDSMGRTSHASGE